ncbi:hypothetical protein M378DRAFT_180174 [Amanita muscaria Koide BX008]|uniref:Histone chaperone domain-containing protein n=1 Tax=Amanita muscaria (strain Koide BX008) TaxID=946122 RepID=A0A0C2T3R5_AMAMK|nr:hypothetical protein M378DRAFT_180174 [Amanita muscaria Koide BX008]
MSSRTTPKKTSDESSDNVPARKGKGKAVEAPEQDVEMGNEEEEEEEEEEEDGDEEEEEEEEEEDFDEMDPGNIVGRRTRGKRVDYTSKEALEKAGLKSPELEEDDDEDGGVEL